MTYGGEGWLKGTIKRWLSGRGYGFIEPDEGGKEIFVHQSEIARARDASGVSALSEGLRVQFDVQSTYKGPRAVNVKLIE